ncbi:MAG: DNA gyrase subunit A, partial [Arsenophonus sp. ET-DL12-MAG3]
IYNMLSNTSDNETHYKYLKFKYDIQDNKYYLSEQQAQAILDLRLQKLTNLEHKKILDEYSELLKKITSLLYILTTPDRLMEVIRKELEIIKEDYPDSRRTEIIENREDINIEDLINQKNVIVTLSH